MKINGQGARSGTLTTILPGNLCCSTRLVCASRVHVPTHEATIDDDDFFLAITTIIKKNEEEKKKKKVKTDNHLDDVADSRTYCSLGGSSTLSYSSVTFSYDYSILNLQQARAPLDVEEGLYFSL